MLGKYAVILGLPPQVRGARDEHVGHRVGHRLTPAGAGSTRTQQRNRAPARAYPRRCGEHVIIAIHSLPPLGLPPQVRGAQHLELQARNEVGLTPAGAGSTVHRSGFSGGCPAYPRRCGEHPGSRRRTVSHVGLPPQVRGALRLSVRSVRCAGLTPAGAGSTRPVGMSARRSWAYPRRCGEHSGQRKAEGGNIGLPPQVRGAPRPLPLQGGRGRAYPRRCGEHTVEGLVAPFPYWLTPAGAGST